MSDLLQEIKLRQLTNQYLIRKADRLTVLRDLCGMQAQFYANAVHALRIRCADFDEETVGQGAVKNWTLRGTVHVFAEDDLPLFMHCRNGADYRSETWPGYCIREQNGVQSTWVGAPDDPGAPGDPGHPTKTWMLTPDRQAFFARLVLDAVASAPKTRDELKEICLREGMTETESDAFFHPWGGGIRDLCSRGFLNYVVSEKKAYTPAPWFSPIPEELARLTIARRYFTHIAPATIRDAAHFLGTTQNEVKYLMEELPITSAVVGKHTYYWIENDRPCVEGEVPPCILLAGFDPLMLGYHSEHNLFLPTEHRRGIFNTAGIINPAILLRGRVVGKWQKKKSRLNLTPFEPLDEADRRLITQTAEALWQDIHTVAWL